MRRFLPLVCALGLAGAAVPTAVLVAGAATPGQPAAATPAPGPVDPLQQQLQQALAQQQQIMAAKTALSGQVQAAAAQQSDLRGLIDANQKQIAQTLQQIAVAEQRFQEASVRAGQERAAAEEARRHEIRDKALLAGYLREAYVSRQSLTDYLLSSSSFPEFVGRATALSQLSASGTDLVRRVQADAAEAEKEERAAQADADAAQQAAAALALQKAGLQQQVDKESGLVDRLGSEMDAAKQEIKDADKQDAALAQRIADLRIQQLDQAIAASEQAAWEEAQFYLQNHLTGLPPGQAYDPQHPAAVRFVWPVPGSTITQPFGPSPYDFEPPYQGFPHFHTGIDMAAPEGTPVYSAGDGIVVAATQSSIGYGNHIIIAHDGHTLTLYGHLDTMLVHPGDAVHQGQLIGLMGSTGNSTGPHTHFEVRIDNNPVDPGPYLPPLPPGASGPPPIGH